MCPKVPSSLRGSVIVCTGAYNNPEEVISVIFCIIPMQRIWHLPLTEHQLTRSVQLHNVELAKTAASGINDQKWVRF